MILTIDVGNSQIYGGVYEGEKLRLQFRRASKGGASSDEFGLFFRSVLRENEIDPDRITQVAMCTVVPEVQHSLRNAFRKYFDLNPFVLQAGVRTGLKIKYRNPLEVGADRIANAIAAVEMYPRKNLIIMDFGTATTFCAVNAQKEYLGGVIIPGLKIAMRSLETNTSKLPSVEIVAPDFALSRSTVESIQSGLYYGTLGAVREICNRIQREVFSEPPLLIGTGGFASLFAKSGVFDKEVPDLVLEGLRLALEFNEEKERVHVDTNVEM